MRYVFADFELDTVTYELRRAGAIVHTEPLVFDLIRFLVTNPGRVLTKDELIEELWAGRIVSDATVASCIKSARRALGDSGTTQAFIRTIRGRGIQCVASVDIREVAASPGPAMASNRALDPNALAAVPDAEPHPPRIAVLPFTPARSSSTTTLLGDAVAQEVILELSRLHWLAVTARGSSFKFRGPVLDSAVASQVLGVDYLLMGTIDADETECAIYVEILRAPEQQVVWAERFTTSLPDVMHMRGVLAAAIVGALEPRLQHHEAVRAARIPTERLDAWSAYHRGLWHMFRFNRDDNQHATILFEQAIRLDPVFARAHAGLSFTHFQNAFLGFTTDKSSERRHVFAHAERSLALDPMDPFANLTMGRAHWLAGDLESALPWMDRSIAFSPNSAFALYNSALVGTLLGGGDNNEAKVMRAITLSPIDPLNYAMLATRALTHLLRSDTAAAVEWAERAVHAPNAHIQIMAIAAMVHDLAGNAQKAKSYVAQILSREPSYRRSDFTRFFPFRDAAMRRLVESTLARLGL